MRNRKRITLIALFLLAPFAIAAAGSRQSVSIKGMQFSPASLNVKVGDTVVWTNNDDRDHTVVAADGSFNSGNLRAGASYSHQFDKAGTFAYACTYHPRMKGTVIVAAEK